MSCLANILPFPLALDFELAQRLLLSRNAFKFEKNDIFCSLFFAFFCTFFLLFFVVFAYPNIVKTQYFSAFFALFDDKKGDLAEKKKNVLRLRTLCVKIIMFIKL